MDNWGGRVEGAAQCLEMRYLTYTSPKNIYLTLSGGSGITDKIICTGTNSQQAGDSINFIRGKICPWCCTHKTFLFQYFYYFYKK